ncbi:dihydroxyacetone phosphate acyltransferase [Neolamprologus brichardi]|uniref:dihydroxyacetone phosphate acyltransferase n=1 Tax=Neolamprologus brichardi TaxID=32507 RepID=UPI0003EC002A|nr:dihydroxyacetone phosphate acyltransferase [Neolamprologus brichardi]
MASEAVYSHRDPMLKKRDDFEDILEERRNSSDLRYALKCYTPVLYKGLTPCKVSELKQMVLQSDQLGYVITQVSKEKGMTTDEVTGEAAAILEEMAQRLQLSTVRFFAFTLSKVFKTLFRSICVNEEGLQRLQQAIHNHPVVLLPSHRSYMDFLLMSYILRTAKSLTPKLGLLNIVMDPFLKGEVFDISLVPVSISYERTLEEALYARELLGVPKPKESTSGLFKARKILSEDYGSIHVYFGQPVSVRSLAESRVNRSQFNLIPRHIPTRPSEEILSFVNDSAYRLVRAQEENMVLKPWVLLAFVLLQKQATEDKPGTALDELTEQAVWLRDLSRHYGAFLHWPEEIYNSFSFLRNMFSNEFILCPGATVQDFEEACYLLVKTGALQINQQEVLITERGHRTLAFLTSVLDPFLQGYQVVCRFLCEEQGTLKLNKVMLNSLEDTLGGKLPTQKSVVAHL